MLSLTITKSGIFTKADMERQLRLAEVNHCLSFEQVSDELIEDYNISDGTFDTVVECRYTVPSFTSIGRLYQGVVLSTMKNDDAAPGDTGCLFFLYQ